MSDYARPEREPDHVIAITNQQLREALRLYVEHHRLVPQGGYTVEKLITYPAERDRTAGVSVQMEYWRNSENP